MAEAGGDKPPDQKSPSDAVPEVALLAGESGEDDLLSLLPDDMLSHILSFLDVGQAIRAKLLSHRWRHLYPANPTVRFCPDCFYEEDRSAFCRWPELRDHPEMLVAWIDKVMGQFRAPKIAAFEVVDHAERNWTDYASNVDEWVRLACLMNTERIKFEFVDFRKYETYPFPFHMLSAGQTSNLKHLSLYDCSMAPLSSLAGPILSLKTLELSSVFPHKDIGTFEDMAFYFPNLENLTYNYCNLPGMPKICDLCSMMYNLKSLVVSGYDGLEDFVFHNTNLKLFKYVGTVRSISFKGLNCLQSVDVEMTNTEWEMTNTVWEMTNTEWSGDIVTKFLFSLLNEVPQLIRLSVAMINFKDFRFPSPVSTYKCLKHLRLYGVLSLDFDLENLSRFLQCAPILHELNIHLYGQSLEWSREQLQVPQVHTTESQSYPGQHGCIMHIHSHLKTIKIQRHMSSFGWEDVELIIMLLKSAASIEEVILKGGNREEGEEFEELKMALAQYSPAVHFDVTTCEDDPPFKVYCY